MPPCKFVPSDDDGSDSRSNNIPPPMKKAKISTNKKDSTVTSSMLANETCPQAVSSKQATLSNSPFLLATSWD